MKPWPWLDGKSYYRERWGQPVGRIGVDGGFSCPHRSSPSNQGCAFCSEKANRPPYQAGSPTLAQQIAQGIAFQTERYGFQLFSLYFQAFSSTWAPVPTLRDTFDRGLAEAAFVELVVGTRPDCLPDDVIDLLAGYRHDRREVWVELGLQSSRDETLDRIHRGHDVHSFVDAAGRLRVCWPPWSRPRLLPHENLLRVFPTLVAASPTMGKVQSELGPKKPYPGNQKQGRQDPENLWRAPFSGNRGSQGGPQEYPGYQAGQKHGVHGEGVGQRPGSAHPYNQLTGCRCLHHGKPQDKR